MTLGRIRRSLVEPFMDGDRFVARELRGMRFVTGGPGVFILCDRHHLIASTAACQALARAAGRLGFEPAWAGVTRALSAWALGDVITEAIEEQES